MGNGVKRIRIVGVGALLSLAGCILTPTGWDARTDGGRQATDRYGADDCDAARGETVDMRSEAQNDICVGGWKIRFR